MRPFILLSALLLLTANSRAVASLCRDVLLSSISVSSETMEHTIDDLAQMRFKIDTSKASGSMHSSPAAKLAAAQFDKKYQEVLRANHGQLSEKELRLRIQKKIEALQGIPETKDLDLQTEVKNLQDKALHPYVLHTRQTLEGPSAKPVSNSFEPGRVVYVPQNKLVLEGRQDDVFNMDVIRIDITTGKESVFRDHVRSFKVSQDKQKGLFIFENHYELVDLNTMQTTEKRDFALHGEKLVTSHHEISPDFSRMIFTDDTLKRFVIVDISTGEVRKTIEDDDIDFDIIRAEFINNKTLLLYDPTFSGKNKGLALLYLDTNVLIKHPMKENIQYFISASKSEITVFTRNKLENKLEATIFNALNLMPLRKLTVSNEVNALNRPVLVNDPENISHVILFQRGKYLKLVDTNDISKALYNFDDTYNYGDGNSPLISGVDFSPDGKEIVIRSENYLDIWRLHD